MIVGIVIALQVSNWNEDRFEQRQVRVMANALQAAAGMQPRLEHETPTLVENAREIIALLQKECPE